MTAALALRSVLELALIFLLIYGFYKEDKVIAFEEKLRIILAVNYRRCKRKKKEERRAFRVVPGEPQGRADGSFHVA